MIPGMTGTCGGVPQGASLLFYSCLYTADEGELDILGRPIPSCCLDESPGSARTDVVGRPGKFTVHLPARTW